MWRLGDYAPIGRLVARAELRAISSPNRAISLERGERKLAFLVLSEDSPISRQKRSLKVVHWIGDPENALGSLDVSD